MRFQRQLSVVTCENSQLGGIRLGFRKPGDKKKDAAEKAEDVEDRQDEEASETVAAVEPEGAKKVA
jgi:hypothetical protein